MEFVVKQASDASKESFESKVGTTALGLAGEAGEVADHIKKVFYQGKVFDRHAFLNELGDALWYITFGCYSMDITLEELMQMNVTKLSKRYSSGKFTVEESENRKEK